MARNGRGVLALAIVAGGAVALAVAGILAYAATDVHDNPYASRQLLIGASAVGVGTYVAARRPQHRMGWVLLAAGIGSWLTFTVSSGLDWLFVHTTWPEWSLRAILHAGTPGWLITRGCLIVLVPLVFPNPSPSGRAGRFLWAAGITVIAVTVVAHSRLHTFEHFAGEEPRGWSRVAEVVATWGQRAMWVLAVAAGIEMLRRVARTPVPYRRAMVGFAVMIAILLVPSGAQLFAIATSTELPFVIDDLELWGEIVLPVVLAVGILRHGLLDIRVVVRRFTVYALLVASAALAYAAIVAMFSLFLESHSTLGIVVATGAVAAISVPLYARIERLVARRVFGRRDAPYETIAALGARLEFAAAGDDALRLVAETVAAELRLPYVAVEVQVDGEATRVATAGSLAVPGERYPLSYQGEELGHLVVAPRTERDRFTAGEHALLEHLARQIGVVAHDVALAEQLRRSKMALVAAREEERRRLRADLHDGLGPTLASIGLGLGVAADRLSGERELAELLAELDDEVQTAIADIRRLVHDLRPPHLDELGLVGAIAEHGDRVTRRANGTGPRVQVRAYDELPALPAAIEVVAYRVVLEAITNVVRHADASRCEVDIRCNGALEITIRDDGCGVRGGATGGLGLRSMRSRVADVGGTVVIDDDAPRGTRIDIWLPLLVAPA